MFTILSVFSHTEVDKMAISQVVLMSVIEKTQHFYTYISENCNLALFNVTTDNNLLNKFGFALHARASI